MLSSQNARLSAARRLTRRRDRRETGLFLAEGLQSVREAVRTGAAVEIFATADALHRHRDLLTGLQIPVDEVSEKDAAALSETVTPQGIVAVCRTADTLATSVEDVIAHRPRLIVMLVEPNDPGNLGTIIRTADAAGADAVVLDGGVDPRNGKVVRASAGSLFHLPVVECATDALLGMTTPAGIQALAATGHGDLDLDELADSGALSRPTVWIFGSEAHGLPQELITAADESVRVPIHGSAESLNLASAAAVCLYASARAQRSDRAGPGKTLPEQGREPR